MILDRDKLLLKIDKLMDNKNNSGFNLISDKHHIGIRFVNLMDSAIIVFGGYGTKIISFECDFTSPQKMLEQYEKIMKQQTMNTNWNKWEIIKKNNF